METEIQKYPVGRFEWPENLSSDEINQYIREIEQLPERVRKTVEDLTDTQLKTCYRKGGWTVRQVVHHLADSHMNSYIRFKLALTEDNPTIKPYLEASWAELEDGRDAPVDISLDILESVHKRMVLMLRSMTDEQLKRTFFHPETNRSHELENVIALYAWHGRHHLAHIENALDQSL